jgi:hypothetical protein
MTCNATICCVAHRSKRARSTMLSLACPIACALWRVVRCLGVAGKRNVQNRRNLAEVFASSHRPSGAKNCLEISRPSFC